MAFCYDLYIFEFLGASSIEGAIGAAEIVRVIFLNFSKFLFIFRNFRKHFPATLFSGGEG